jgi:hypothetical protein
MNASFPVYLLKIRLIVPMDCLKSPSKIPSRLPLPKGGESIPLLIKGDEGGLDHFLKAP